MRRDVSKDVHTIMYRGVTIERRATCALSLSRVSSGAPDEAGGMYEIALPFEISFKIDASADALIHARAQ